MTKVTLENSYRKVTIEHPGDDLDLPTMLELLKSGLSGLGYCFKLSDELEVMNLADQLSAKERKEMDKIMKGGLE